MDKPDIYTLYVDNDPIVLKSFESNFGKDYNVFTAVSEKEAREILANKQIHVLITDHKMASATGTTCLEEAIKEYPEQARILLTAFEDNEAVTHACYKGLICKYVVKPYDYNELKNAIDLAYEVYSLRQVKKALYKEWIKTHEALNLLKLRVAS